MKGISTLEKNLFDFKGAGFYYIIYLDYRITSFNNSDSELTNLASSWMNLCFSKIKMHTSTNARIFDACRIGTLIMLRGRHVHIAEFSYIY